LLQIIDMPMDQSFDPGSESGTTYHCQTAKEENSVSALDNFIHGKTRILNTKLEVLASEIRERWLIRVTNLERINDEKVRVLEMISDLSRRANYMLRQHREKAPFYQQWFDLERERRSEDVECWRDVVMVMRDFLVVWEAHEQAKTKAIFLDHV
jgi:hypothetical protein